MDRSKTVDLETFASHLEGLAARNERAAAQCTDPVMRAYWNGRASAVQELAQLIRWALQEAASRAA